MTSLADVLPPLDPNSSLPLYQQLQRAIRMAIENRVLGPDDALPAERQIAIDLAVSRITVRKASEGLVEEGLLVRRQGSGNFVSARIEKNFAKLTSFSEDMRARTQAPPRLAEEDRRHGIAGRGADTGTQPRYAGLSLSPHPLCRRRADVR